MNFAKFYQNKSIGYRVAVGGIILVTAILAPFHSYINSVTIALTLLLVVLFTATIFGSRPALLASILGVLCFNFFFLEPLYTFTIADSQNWIALFAFLATALMAGQLSSYANRRAEEAESKQKEIKNLYAKLQTAFEKESQAEAIKQSEKLKAAWEKWSLGVKLEVLHSPYRSLSQPLLEYFDKVDRQADDDLLTIILPEFVPAKWWHQILHNQSSLILKGYLLFKKRVIVTNVPYHLKK